MHIKGFYLFVVLVTNSRPGFLHAWVFLTKIYTKLHLYDDAQQASVKAYKLNQSFGSSKILLSEILDRLSLEFLAGSNSEENWQTAVNMYNKVLLFQSVSYFIFLYNLSSLRVWICKRRLFHH